jgi:hypothetical protein
MGNDRPAPSGTDLLNGFVRASRDRLNAAARGDRVREERAAVMARLFNPRGWDTEDTPFPAPSVAVSASDE